MELASIQEGEEWIAKLRNELDALTYDLINFSDVLNEHTVANIEYAIGKIANYIAEITIEISFMEEV